MRVPLRVGDLIVYAFAVVLIAVGLSGMYTMGISHDERKVVVEVNGREVYSCRVYKGMEPVEFRVNAGNGQYNVVLITYEGVRIKEANCPDQICVKSGFIRFSGQAIVCLPHKVVVKIISGREEVPDVDDIAS
ncbi:hypothetical protein JOD02_001387 [Caldicoprobacter guelmensis]|uniref:NusG domain II-containing protein n=1 Tax=Caldicoprobacter guelmensis TaxID=1170224 RepID=UPI00195A4636|nr:NusG domain II-containing protein [Caldicoprobacter guelmensis]MBM7582530.1 hypothetical protein [Caldicoprobacter guelmensis]